MGSRPLVRMTSETEIPQRSCPSHGVMNGLRGLGGKVDVPELRKADNSLIVHGVCLDIITTAFY